MKKSFISLLASALALLQFSVSVVTADEESVAENVFEIIQNSPNHTILAAAIEAADLVDALEDDEMMFTVFAPLDSGKVNSIQVLLMVPCCEK